MNSLQFRRSKEEGRRLSMVTCYDACMARIIATTSVDSILVGDSVAMVVHGYPTTLAATVEMMSLHISAVARACGDKLLVGDMPFLSVRKGLESAMNSVGCLVQAGAHAVKIEGALGNLEIIRHIVESGIPVMGHLGLTPQWYHAQGGFRVQSRLAEEANRLVEQALQLEDVGCFSLVLECIPSSLAARVTEQLSIPTIGIGAGPHVDGQVLVINDLLGMSPGFKPKFLRTYADGHAMVYSALNAFHEDVACERFPTLEESYV